MSIQHKISFGIIGLYLALSTVSVSANSLIPASPAYKSSVFEDPCTEPAPTNFQITARTPASISVAWDAPVSAPFQYNIKAFEVLTGNLVYDQNIAGNLVDWVVPNLQPNTLYEIRNTPVCADLKLSPNSVTTLGQTMILDLLVNSFSPSNDGVSCTVKGGGEGLCDSDPTEEHIVTFRIEKTDTDVPDFRYFGVYKATDDCIYTTIMVRPEDEDSPFQFFCNYNSAPSPSCNGVKVSIEYNGVVVSSLSISQPSNGQKQLVGNVNVVGFEIQRLENSNGHFHGAGTCFDDLKDARPAPSKGRTAYSEQAVSLALSAAPNPFTDQLDIQIPFNHPSEDTKISLYDLQGRQVFSELHSGDQQTIHLSTVSLAPGMYFLRAESGGISETIKLVKTQ